MYVLGIPLWALVVALLLVLKLFPRARVTLFNLLTYLSLTGWYYYRRVVVKKGLWDPVAKSSSASSNACLNGKKAPEKLQLQPIKLSSNSTESTTSQPHDAGTSSNQRLSDSQGSDRNSCHSQNEALLSPTNSTSSGASAGSSKSHEHSASHSHHHHGLGFLKKLRIKSDKQKRKAQHAQQPEQLSTSPLTFESPENSPNTANTPPAFASKPGVPKSMPTTGSVEEDAVPRKRVYTGRKKPPNWGER